MTFLTTETVQGEGFWQPISTGVAVHRTVEQALVAAVLEAVERDAAALCWLQKLPLPLLDPAVLRPETAELLAWSAERGLRTFVFDLTTDLGIPVAWCLQLCDGSVKAAQLAATGAGPDSATAAHNAVLECVGAREFYTVASGPPRTYDRYVEPTDGARHMARRARRPAFDFLTDRLDERATVPGRDLGGGDTAAGRLARLLEVLREHDQPAYAADLTCREAVTAGLSCVRVVLPRLVPMSLRPRAAFRGTPRLFDAPARMGYPVLPESRLNPYPIPLG
jgi:ribosomal protein S12 methylthiotransferase accessory factor